MVYFVGIVVAVILVGGFFAVYRSRKKEEAFEMPALTNRFRNRDALARELIAWSQRVDAPGLGAWLGSMGQDERAALVKELQRFCKDAGFKLAWIVEDQIEDEAVRDELAQATQQFLQAHRVGAQARDGLQVYVALVDLLQNPDGRKNRPKTQAVYLQLANKGVVPQADIDLLFEKDRRRWEHAAKSIAVASRADRENVNQAIRAHVLGEGMPPTNIADSAAVDTTSSARAATV